MIFLISIFLSKYNRAKYIPLGSPDRLTPFSVECSLPEKTTILLEETISTAVVIFDNFTKIYIVNHYQPTKITNRLILFLSCLYLNIYVSYFVISQNLPLS